MEDLATARISVAQTAQRVIHAAKDDDSGEVHDMALVKRVLLAEEQDIVERLAQAGASGDALDAAKGRYRQATKITMRWVKNYTEFDYRSLGSYTRDDLAAIAEAADAI